MTREEAISIMNVIIHMLEPQYDNDRVEEAVDMAIKALEQYTDKAKEVGELQESLQKANATNTTLIKLLEGKHKPCEDAVSREEVIDELNRLGRNAFKDDTDYDNFFAFIDNLSSVTPTRKKGKWEYVGDNCFKCTKCGQVYTMDQFININNYCDDSFPRGCPYCGAEMEEDT